MALTVHALTKLQADYPDYRMELIDGEVRVMSPSGYEADEVSSELVRVLGNWVRPRQPRELPGRGVSASGGGDSAGRWRHPDHPRSVAGLVGCCG